MKENRETMKARRVVPSATSRAEPDMAAVLAAVRAKEHARGSKGLIRDHSARRFTDTAACEALRTTWGGVPYFEPLILVRSKLVEDAAKSLMKHDASLMQVVSLGAGYSTFLRGRQAGLLRKARLFECDYPDVMARKRSILGSAYDAKLLGIDLSSEASRLPNVLRASGFRRSQRSIFIMEGLLYYLRSYSQIKALFSSISTLCGDKGGLVIFDVYTAQASKIATSVRKAIKSGGLTQKIAPASVWLRRLEVAGFRVRTFGNLAWLDRWKRLAPFRSNVSSCLFVAEFPPKPKGN